jgi:hypothetical protein
VEEEVVTILLVKIVTLMNPPLHLQDMRGTPVEGFMAIIM